MRSKRPWKKYVKIKRIELHNGAILYEPAYTFRGDWFGPEMAMSPHRRNSLEELEAEIDKAWDAVTAKREEQRGLRIKSVTPA